MILSNRHILVLASATMLALSSIKAQEVTYPTLDMMDEYFTSSSTQSESIVQFFTSEAAIRSITYNEDGSPVVNTFSASAFENELKALRADYDLFQEPVVLLSQGYGSLETFFCSVHTRLIHKIDGDTIHLRSMQSFQLINNDGWKIHHLVIQNENLWSPISEQLWPKELTHAIGINPRTVPLENAEAFDEYDPSRVYNVSEVDEAPVYPGQAALFETLLETFDVVISENDTHSPFTIEIQEDGLAQLKYVNDLSGAQIDKAKTFVNSMLIWYPAIKDKASVRCKLIMYIR